MPGFGGMSITGLCIVWSIGYLGQFCMANSAVVGETKIWNLSLRFRSGRHVDEMNEAKKGFGLSQLLGRFQRRESRITAHNVRRGL